MESNVNSFFQEVENIAAILEDEKFKEIVSDIRRNITYSKLRILVVGVNNSGRFSIVNGIAGIAQLLPVSPLPKTNALINIVYGDSFVEAVSNDGTKVTVPEEMNKKILLDSDNINKFKNIIIYAKSDILKICDLKIYSIEAQYSEELLKNLFSNTDYVLLVTNATAFISIREKEFISKLLSPYFGFERVAVLINKIDLIKESERISVTELAKKYFASLRNQPLILLYSAETILKEISGNRETLLREDISFNIIKNTLIGNPYALKRRAIHQTAHFCINEISRIIDKQKNVCLLNSEEFTKLSEALNLQNSVLQEKINFSRQKVSFSINCLLRERYLCEVDSFASCLKDRLPEEIMSVDELSNVKRYLPGYLEQLWSDFFDYSLPHVLEEIHVVVTDIQRQVTIDLREISGDVLDKYPELLKAASIKPVNINPWLKHKKSKNELSKAASAIQTSGFIVLPILSLPLGVAMIGVGQLMRIAGKNSVRVSEQQALIETAINSELELELRIKKQVEFQFENINCQLMDYIESLYTDKLNSILSSLEERKQEKDTLEEKEKQLCDLQSKQIPRLQELLSKIDSE